MASKRLLARLKFRSFPVPDVLPFTTVSIRISEVRPEPAVRKFARDYIPVLLYKFPELSVSQARAASGEPSSVTVLAGGVERGITVAGKTEKGIYCEATGIQEADIVEQLPLIVKHQDRRRKKSGRDRAGSTATASS